MCNVIVQRDLVLPMVLIQVATNVSVTCCLHCREYMDLSALRQQILLSNKPASGKAETFVLKSQVNDLSKDEWRSLITGIPEDVEKEIGRLKTTGTQLHLRMSLIVRGSNWTRNVFRCHNGAACH